MRRPKSPLRTYLGGFVLLVANVFLIVIVLMTAVSLVVVRGGLQSSPVVSSAAFGVAAMLFICAVVATSVIVMMQRLFVWPLYRIADVLNEVAAGNFDARIDLGRGRYPSEVRAFADSVNHLRPRSWRASSFCAPTSSTTSHEFKTPIATLAHCWLRAPAQAPGSPTGSASATWTPSPRSRIGSRRCRRACWRCRRPTRSRSLPTALP